MAKGDTISLPLPSLPSLSPFPPFFIFPPFLHSMSFDEPCGHYQRPSHYEIIERKHERKKKLVRYHYPESRIRCNAIVRLIFPGWGGYSNQQDMVTSNVGSRRRVWRRNDSEQIQRDTVGVLRRWEGDNNETNMENDDCRWNEKSEEGRMRSHIFEWKEWIRCEDGKETVKRIVNWWKGRRREGREWEEREGGGDQ